MQNINKNKLLLAIAVGFFLLLGNSKITFAAAPSATNLSAAESYTEDTTLNLVDIVASDPDGGSLTATLTISNTAAGALSVGTSNAVTSTYNGLTGVWTATGAIADVNVLLAGVSFVPSANFNSNFTIATNVSDGVSSVSGTKNITGIAVNDAPVLDTSKSPITNGVSENNGAPIGAVGTLVNTLVDFAVPAGQVDNVTDVDSGPLLGIAVVATNSHLTCYYSLNGGTTWVLMGDVSNSSARLLASDGDNRIYCVAGYNVAGLYSDGLTIRAWDRTSGVDGNLADASSVGGSTAFSSASDTVTQNIIASAGSPITDPNAFVTVWDSNISGATPNNEINFPAFDDAVYDIDWGDGIVSHGMIGAATHVYATPGMYTLTTTGAGFNGMAFGYSGDYNKILDVRQWGAGTWKSMSGAFFGASNMIITATDTPDLSQVTDFQYTFRGTTFTSGIEDWDVSNVASFVGAFQDSSYNGDITGWDMSSATNTSAMFYNDPNFNQDISGWAMGNVSNMNAMFYHDTAFNQDISGWSTGSVSNFGAMFEGATAFNQNLGTWDVRSATAMNNMFHGDTLSTPNYDGILSGWLSHGIFSLHTSVHFDAGNSKFCDITSWLMLVEVPNTWSITDGGLGDCNLVLTEVTPITGTVRAEEAVYYFDANDEVDNAQSFSLGGYEVEQPNNCDHCEVHIDPDAHTLYFTNLHGGDHLDFKFRFAAGDGVSNWLNIGPFYVRTTGSGGGSYAASPTGVSNQGATHPNGTLIIDNKTIYLIKDGKRWGFRDAAEYASYGYKFGQVVAANSADMALPFDKTNILKAMVGTLVIDASDKKTVYMIGTNYTKRGFVSQAVFSGLGYNFKNLPTINLNDYPTGPVISSAKDSHPEGSLVLDGKTVWWIVGGSKQGFESQQVLDTYGFTSDRLVKANPADLALPSGNLIKLRDGTLVQENGSYYIISDSKKRMFNGSAKATSMGYNLSNFVTAILSGYSLGQGV